MLNYNLQCLASDTSSLFPGSEDSKFGNLLSFVERFYKYNTLSFESIKILASNLLLLRSADLTVRHIQEMIQRDDLLNSPRQVLLDILPSLLGDENISRSLNELLDCT